MLTSNLDLLFVLIRYDFDGDNLISPDEVFILLSYIPFKNQDNASPDTLDLSPLKMSQRQSSSDSLMRGSSEGMYNRSGHATNMNQEQRELEQREIKNFVQQAF